MNDRPAASAHDLELALAGIENLLASRGDMEPDVEELLGLLDAAGVASTTRLTAALMLILTRYRDALTELAAHRAAVAHHEPRVERNRLLAKAEDLITTSPDQARVLIALAAEWGRS